MVRLMKMAAFRWANIFVGNYWIYTKIHLFFVSPLFGYISVKTITLVLMLFMDPLAFWQPFLWFAMIQQKRKEIVCEFSKERKGGYCESENHFGGNKDTSCCFNGERKYNWKAGVTCYPNLLPQNTKYKIQNTKYKIQNTKYTLYQCWHWLGRTLHPYLASRCCH